MGKTGRIICVTFSVILLISYVYLSLVFGFGFLADINMFLPENKQRARETAEAYLDEKYEQEMIFKYLEVHFETRCYLICFTPADDTELTFFLSVSMWNDIWSENYIDRMMMTGLKNEFTPKMQAIWEENAELYYGIVDGKVNLDFDKDILPDVNKGARFDELEQYYNYGLIVELQAANEESEEEEARRILTYIQWVQDSGRHPAFICVEDADADEGYVIPDRVFFHDWETIDTIEQVVAEMNEQT